MWSKGRGPVGLPTWVSVTWVSLSVLLGCWCVPVTVQGEGRGRQVQGYLCMSDLAKPPCVPTSSRLQDKAQTTCFRGVRPVPCLVHLGYSIHSRHFLCQCCGTDLCSWLGCVLFSWKGLPDASFAYHCPAGDGNNDKEGALFYWVLTVCQILCRVLCRSRKDKEKPRIRMFSKHHICKRKPKCRGQLLNMHFIMERVELGTCLLGGSGILHFRPACAVEFVALMLPCLRFQQFIFPRIAWHKCPMVSVRRMDPGQRGERTIF